MVHWVSQTLALNCPSCRSAWESLYSLNAFPMSVRSLVAQNQRFWINTWAILCSQYCGALLGKVGCDLDWRFPRCCLATIRLTLVLLAMGILVIPGLRFWNHAFRDPVSLRWEVPFWIAICSVASCSPESTSTIRATPRLQTQLPREQCFHGFLSLSLSWSCSAYSWALLLTLRLGAQTHRIPL